MKLPTSLRPYFPNTSTALALVANNPNVREGGIVKAFWPVRLTQIVGGKTWSLSLVLHLTPQPVITRDGDE